MSENFTISCYSSETLLKASAAAYFTSYYIISSAYFFIGLPGQILAFLIYYKQCKTQKAYTYQIFSAINDTAVLLTQSAYVFGMQICSRLDLAHPGCVWYQKSYTLMWYTAHLGISLENTTFTISVLLALCTTVDRILALTKPLVYRNLRHGCHQGAALILCLTISILVNASDVNLYSLSYENETYSVFSNLEYQESPISNVIWCMRNIILSVGIVGLVLGNWVMVYYYRRRNKKSKTAATGINDKKALGKKAQERILILLTVSQSFFKSFSASVVIAYYAAGLVSVSFFTCYDPLVVPVCDAVLMLGGMLEFYTVLGLSKQFRTEVSKVLQRLKFFENSC